MTHIVTNVSKYDKKRWKVTLDEGAVTFLLYNGELKYIQGGAGNGPAAEGLLAAGKEAGEGICQNAPEISGDAYERIMEEVLLPRAKKRVLFYLKGGDKTEFQIKSKLREGFYPEEIIEKTMEFLKKYSLSDDRRYAENFVASRSESLSKRELEAKLLAKGVDRNDIKRILEERSGEDEYTACEKAAKKHFTGDRNRDIQYLMRKGYSFDAIEHAVNAAYKENN